MVFLWLIAGVALGIAVVALITARRAAARMTQLSEMHWELKYQHLELRKQVDRISGAEPAAPAVPATFPPPRESFVPLTSLKR